MASQSDFVREVYEAGLNIGLSPTASRVAAAQAALETGYGRSVKGNNYFGIKAGRSWSGAVQSFNTWEEVNGQRQNIRDRFRAYATPEESLKDWANLMDRRFPEVLRAETFKDAVQALGAGKAGGYATDSKYNSKLGYIDRNFTQKAAATSPVPANVPAPSFLSEQMRAPPTPGLLGAQPETLNVAGAPSGTLYGVSPYGGAVPTPVSRNAPVDQVERGTLANVSTASLPGNISMPTQGPRFSPPSSFAAAPSMSPAQRAELTAGLTAQANAMRAPAPPANMATVASQYGQYRSPSAFSPQNTAVAQAQSRAANIAPPTDLTTGIAPTAALSQYQQPPVPGLQRVAPPAALPSVPQYRPPEPVVAPPAPVQRQQVAAPQAAPQAPPTPSFTGQDVWSGRATSGIATNGNQMTRNPDGTVSMTSARYGYTETMNPDGSYRSTTAPGLFGLDAAANRAFGNIGQQGIQGPLGQPGIQPQAQATQPGQSRLGQGFRGAAGSVAGSMIGGLLGPVGALLGGYLGKQMAQGKNPVGGLLGQLTPEQQFQRSYTPGLAFPERPTAPANPGNGQLTEFGERAARGEVGGRNSQAGRAARGEISGLF